MEICEHPLFTETFPDSRKFVPMGDSAYIYGVLEERSEHSPNWISTTNDVNFIKIEEVSRSSIRSDLSNLPELSLRSTRQLSLMLESISEENIYIDFTGLPHNVWAPLVKLLISSNRNIMGVYVEPDNYSLSSNPIDGQIFDLSDKIEGISPLPGFSSLNDEHENSICIPLLGFEGTRFAYLLEQIESPGDKVFPIIGVPGFQAEYPFYTFHGNMRVLKDSHSWKNVRFVRANCPFSLYYDLITISKENPNCNLKISPIGTKPHALGAILYKINNHRSVEIIYDHPKRKIKRSTGSAARHIYLLSRFQKYITEHITSSA